jgi:putative flavoprotein involved in K+ transport
MRIPVVVVGAGHAGLAVSRVLAERAVEHVVLERGEIANTWKSERWDSLRLLTPNWQTRLPGYAYGGDDPDGFMAVAELIEVIERYAAAGGSGAPIHTHTEVTSVSTDGDGYRVETTAGTWDATAVVLASGAFNRARVPAVAASLPAAIDQVDPLAYKRAEQLRPGRVLVVGASATGVQLADEILRSGRDVTIAVGEHVRLPRTYRGRDIMWWLDRIGRLDERYDEVDDLVRARHVPSPQVAGTVDRSDLDLNVLTDRGAGLVGRLSAVVDGKGYFSGALANVCNLADLKLGRLLDTIDDWAASAGLGGERGPRPTPTRIDAEPRLAIDLVAEGYETVVWATGFQADYTWLHVPVCDRKGEIRHDGGVVGDAPGLYRVGLNFLRRRKSSFIHGAEDDAVDIVEHLTAYLRSDPSAETRHRGSRRTRERVSTRVT